MKNQISLTSLINSIYIKLKEIDQANDHCNVLPILLDPLIIDLQFLDNKLSQFYIPKILNKEPKNYTIISSKDIITSIEKNINKNEIEHDVNNMFRNENRFVAEASSSDDEAEECETPQGKNEESQANPTYNPLNYFKETDTREIKIQKLNSVLTSLYGLYGEKLSRPQRVRRNKAIRSFLKNF